MQSNSLRRLTSTGSGRWLAAGVSLLALAVYALTIVPAVGFYDSAELALRAAQLGATHAPGAPLHTLLGFVSVQPFSEPAFGTNILSALSVAFAAGLMSLLLWNVTRDVWAAVLGPLVFAFNYQVWANAVVTEVYGLSILCVALAIWFAWRWHQQDSDGLPVTVSIACAVSLGAYFGNILLLPAFAWLIFETSRNRARDLTTFLVIVVIGIGAIAGANFVLAANQPPFGADSPDSLINIWRYMSGSQHEPLALRGIDFFANRLLEHAWGFSRHYLFIGIPLGIYGAYLESRNDRPYSRFLVIAFAFYIGYFTLFGPGDYYAMVVPAYFIFSLWLALAIHGLAAARPASLLSWSGRGLLMLYVVTMVSLQAGERRDFARDAAVQDFIDTASAAIPENALAIAAWREFTVLNYYQQLHGFRPDIDFIVGARTVRRYPHGEVGDYLDLVAEQTCARTVVTNKLHDELVQQYDIAPLTEDLDWYRLIRKEDQSGEDECSRPPDG